MANPWQESWSPVESVGDRPGSPGVVRATTVLLGLIAALWLVVVALSIYDAMTWDDYVHQAGDALNASTTDETDEIDTVYGLTAAATIGSLGMAAVAVAGAVCAMIRRPVGRILAATFAGLQTLSCCCGGLFVVAAYAAGRDSESNSELHIAAVDLQRADWPQWIPAAWGGIAGAIMLIGLTALVLILLPAASRHYRRPAAPPPLQPPPTWGYQQQPPPGSF